jgi:hypothetical protein
MATAKAKAKRKTRKRARLLTPEQVMSRLTAEKDIELDRVTCSLRPIRHGNNWRFSQEDLEEWIRQQRETNS